MIDFRCDACGKSIQVDEALAGKRGKCPGCSQVLVVPEADLVELAPGPAFSPRVRVGADSQPAAAHAGVSAVLASKQKEESRVTPAGGLKAQAETPAFAGGSHRWWLIILITVSFFAAMAMPAVTLLVGLAILLVCGGLLVGHTRARSAGLLRLSGRRLPARLTRVGIYLFLGVLLFTTGLSLQAAQIQAGRLEAQRQAMAAAARQRADDANEAGRVKAEQARAAWTKGDAAAARTLLVEAEGIPELDNPAPINLLRGDMADAEARPLLNEAAGHWSRGDRGAAESALALAEAVEHQTLGKEIHSLRTEFANSEALPLMEEATAAAERDDPDAAEALLARALAIPNATPAGVDAVKGQIEAARVRLDNGRFDRLVVEASEALAADEATDAKRLLGEASELPFAETASDAQLMLDTIALATEQGGEVPALMELEDSDFQRVVTGGPLPAIFVTGNPAVDAFVERKVRERVPAVEQARRRMRLAAEDAEERRQAAAKRASEAREIASKPLRLESWTWRTEYGYAIAEGEVTNRSSKRMENVQVVVTFYTEEGTLVTSARALLDYNPLLPGQTTPFSAIATSNPRMASAGVNFSRMFGGSIGFSKAEK